MRSTLKSLLLSLLALGSLITMQPSLAQDDSEVTQNFKQIGREMRAMNRMDDPAELAATLTEIRQYAVNNTSLTPDVLADASAEELAEFHAGVDQLIAMMDEAIAFASAGDLDSAKAKLSEMGDFRGEKHDQYGI